MAFSYSLALDAQSMSPEAITVDTQAPNANDVELRVSLTNTPTREQVFMILEAFRRRLAGANGSIDIQNI